MYDFTLKIYSLDVVVFMYSDMKHLVKAMHLDKLANLREGSVFRSTDLIHK